VRHRLLTALAALAAAATAGAVAAVAVFGGTAPAARPAVPKMSLATVVRTSLRETVLTAGTLGYAPTRPVVNELTGTYTWLPAVGHRVTAGHPLYRVDDLPVVLMAGRTPAWRSFSLGMTAGRDVTQLQANLIAEGYATGLLSGPSGYFDSLTAAAVRRWQAARGYPVTGQVLLGQIVFLPAAIRVGDQRVAVGQQAVAGQQPLLATTSRRTVTVPLNPDLPPVRRGQAVSIVLPSQSATPGKVVAVGPVPAGSVPASSVPAGPVPAGSGSGGASGTPAASAAAQQLTVAPARPGVTGTGSGIPVQVSLTVQSVRNVLAVPVTALLALAGGGYGIEVVSASGRHRLLGVTTGIFAAGRVQVSGAGIGPGLTVVVAQ
jgi:peptidoglycan hydrolase-like protein with peptidoglycan-binding domain